MIRLSSSESNQLDLSKVLEELANWQCNEIFVEAGQTLSGALVQAGLVDELILFYAGSVLGNNGKSMFKFDSPISFKSRAQFRVESTEMVGGDIRVNAVNSLSLAELC